jgi:folylpolyglutamate synthase
MITLGLQRITQLLGPLFNANPRLPWKAVHIAGTNGKGSVAALISTFLGHLGYRVGRFTSPHLIDRWDCITINRKVVDCAKFLPIEQHFREYSTKENIGASEFEILTASAFQLFTNEKVDVAVIECGLGGREDATNVLRPCDVILSVLTKVGLDHTEFLGDTLEAIAGVKAGIFKPGVPVVVDQSNEKSVLEVVGERLKELDWGRDGQAGVYFSLDEQRGELEGVIRQLRMARHQAENLYTAWSAFRHAENSLRTMHSSRQPPPRKEPQELRPGTTRPPSRAQNEPDDHMMSGVVPFPPESVVASLEKLIVEAQSSLPGRLQWLTLPWGLLADALAQTESRGPENPSNTKVLLDGAHNAQSATALADYVDNNIRSDPLSIRPDHSKPMTWLLSVKNDKDADNIMSLLLKPHDNVITCSFGPVDGMPWVKPMPATDLAAKARRLTDGTVKALSDYDDGDDDKVRDHSNREDLHNATIAKAIQEAVRTASATDGTGHCPVCITGSLYLIGDVLRCVRNAGGSIYGTT